MKKKYILSLVAFLLLAVNYVNAQGPIYPTIDTYIQQNDPGTVMDSHSDLSARLEVRKTAAGSNNERISFIEFNIGSNTQIVSKALLNLYLWSNANAPDNTTVEVYEFTSGEFSNASSWNNIGEYTISSTALSSHYFDVPSGPSQENTTANGWYTFDITSLYNRVASEAGADKKIKLCLKAADTNLVLRFRSSNYTVGINTVDDKRPYLSTVAASNIVNGGFEDGKTGWQKSWGNWSIVSDKHSGSSAAMVPLAAWGNGLVQRFNVDPQSVYEFKFWAKVSSKGSDLPVYLSIKNGKGQNIGPDPNYTVKVSAKDWTEYAIKFQTIELMDSVDLWVGDGKTDTIYFDDFEVNKSDFIANGGFESGKDGWQKSWGTWSIVSDSHSGSAAALVPLANWGSGLVQRFNAEELSPYELRFWAKVAASSKKVDIKLGLKNSAGKNVGPDPNFLVPVDSKEWKQYSYKFNTLATVDSIDFWLGDAPADSLYIDDIELIPATIITNGSFEAGKAGWAKSSGSFDLVSPGQSGESFAKLGLSNWANVMVQRFNVDPTTSYEMKLWAKVNGTKPVDINLSEKNSAGKNVGPDPNEKISVSTNAWKEYKLKFSTLAEVDSIDFWIGGGTTDSLSIDNISLAPLAFTSTTGIALDSTSLTLKTNGTYKLKVTITPATATNKAVKWVSSDALVATVDENGTVKGIAKGVATITATTVDGGLKATSTVNVVSPTGIQNQLSAAFKVYPNPVVSRLTIENDGAIGRIEICSLTGQVMMNSMHPGNKANVDLSGLSSGLYVLKVYQKETVAGTFKIIKK